MSGYFNFHFHWRVLTTTFCEDPNAFTHAEAVATLLRMHALSYSCSALYNSP